MNRPSLARWKTALVMTAVILAAAILIKDAWADGLQTSGDPSPAGLANGPLTMTWQDCVRLAARNNPTLNSALESLEASRSNYKGSFNGILPHLSVSNSYSDNSFSQSIGTAGNITSESKSWQLDGIASLDLIDVGQWASIETAAAELKQGQANLKVAANTTLLTLYQAFAALLYAQEEITVNTDIRNTWNENAQMVELRYNSGAESKGDNLKTQAQFAEAQANLVQASRDILVAQQQLSQAVGLDHFNTLIVTGTWTAGAAPTPAPDFESLLGKLPQIQLQQAVIEQARAAIKSAHSTLWPTLSLNYTRGREGTTELPSQPYWTFSGVANYPLFGNGLTSMYYASQAAQRTYDKAQQDLRVIHNQELSTLVSAWSEFSQAHDQVLVQQAFLNAARQRKQEYDVLYQSGLQTFEDWILVVQDYVSSQVTFLKTEQSLLLAEAQWRFATGEQLGD